MIPGPSRPSGPTPPAKAGADERPRIEFDYAWGWFQYHASQRLTAFNFFLIIVGLLLVGFAQAIDHHWNAFGFGLGLLGALVATGFLALDVRNAELVIRGREALAKLELGMGSPLSDDDLKRETLAKAIGLGGLGRQVAKLPWLFRHQFWLRFIIAMVGAGFIAGAAWAYCGYAGTDQPEVVSCRASTVLVMHRRGFDLNLVQRSEQQREQGGSNHDRSGPGDSLSGYLHVQPIRVGNHQRVKARRHCGKQPIGSR